MTKIAKFHIEDIFEITGRGLAFAGRIIDGVVSIGNQVEFNLKNSCQRREILGIEGIRHSNPEKVNIGLLIKCLDKEEVNELKSSKKDFTTISIYSKNLKLSEFINWLSTKTIEHKILFNELLLSNLTIMNRAIWYDENTNEQSKLESLKWANELSHRIWNITFDLKRNEDNKSENRLGENINFYAKQSKQLAGHLSSTINSTVNNFYSITEK